MTANLLQFARQIRTPFLAAGDDYDKAGAVLIGAPMDWTSSFRPGSRFGPAVIREVSECIEEYSVYQDRSLAEIRFFDAGDLVLPFGNTESSLELIGRAVQAVMEDGKHPVLIGGEHLVTYPAIRAVHAFHPGMRLLQLDAHADLRRSYIGERLSHASAMRLCHDILGDGRIYQFGVRSGDRDEFAFASDHTRLLRGSPADGLRSVLGELEGLPLYVTIDIDVADPAYAPGTGTPECGGSTSADLLAFLELLGRSHIVGFDLVEVLPTSDLSARTALLAALLVREILLILNP